MTFFSRYRRAFLRSLRIENLVLVREGEQPDAGLGAITGETGAGKTILAQAIENLLGAKGDANTISAAAGEAYVEAETDLPDGFFEDDELAKAAGRTRGRAWPRARPTGLRRRPHGRTPGAARSRARISPPRPSAHLIAMSGSSSSVASPAVVPARRAGRLLRRGAVAARRGARTAWREEPARRGSGTRM